MSDDVEIVLLDRYLAGECTTSERRRIEEWAARSSANAELLDWLRRLRHAAAELPPAWDLDAVWHGITHGEPRSATPSAFPLAGRRARGEGEARGARQLEPLPSRHDGRPFASLPSLAASRRPRVPGRPRFEGVSRSSWSVHALRFAVAVTLVVSALALWRLSGPRTVRARRPVAMRSFETQAGQRAEIHLTDGTFITLAPRSVLRVPATYDRRTREVYLQGQAYFDVARDSTRPFRVHAGPVATRVLGTRFGVGAYPDDSIVSVVVADGAVALGPSDTLGATRAILTRGDLARLERGGRMRVEHGVNVDRYLAWTEGRLVFVNQPLRDVLPQLDRWYDVEIHLADSVLASRPLTATLQHESTDQMLRLIAASLDAHVERHGRSVTLFAGGRSP